jgi:hypothetical protein
MDSNWMLAIVLAFAAATAVIAIRKGFNSLLWLLAGGFIPLIVCAYLPSAKDGDLSPEESRARRAKSTKVAVGLLVASVVLQALIFFGTSTSASF